MTEQRPRHDPLWRHVVGSVLRDERRRQRRTLRQVADPAGISVPYLSEIERGRKEASSEMLAAAPPRALGLRLVDLLGRAHALLAEREARLVSPLELVSVPQPTLQPAPSSPPSSPPSRPPSPSPGRARDRCCWRPERLRRLRAWPPDGG